MVIDNDIVKLLFQKSNLSLVEIRFILLMLNRQQETQDNKFMFDVNSLSNILGINKNNAYRLIDSLCYKNVINRKALNESSNKVRNMKGSGIISLKPIKEWNIKSNYTIPDLDKDTLIQGFMNLLS